ncbi:MAG: hypothetical protein JWR18_2635 [Segetibacter sp.]|nr:hypothetical protein [Segetibacter sp.]
MRLLIIFRLTQGFTISKFDYATVDFTQPNTINYYYRLKGLDNEWKAAGNRRTAYFTSLNPGKFTFEVKAEQYGKWSQIIPLSFTVKPFFYQTFWFKSVIVFVLFIAIFFGIQLYLKHRQEARLKSLVDDRTKELKESNERLQIANKAMEDQNLKLREIAWTQSHVVRTPLVHAWNSKHV